MSTNLAQNSVSVPSSQETSIASQFARYVSLNVFGMVGISCYILADTFFIANGVGADGLAALNFAIVLWAVMQASGLMIGIGGATKFQVFKALGQKDEANKTFTTSLYMGIVVALLLMIVGLFFATPVSRFLGADADTVGLTSVYLMTILGFAPLFILNNILVAFVRNDGYPQLSMIAMLTGSAANIFLDYLFIFGFGWGMFGAAFATGIAPLINISVLSIHFFKRHNTFRVVKASFDLSLMRHIAALGLSSFVVELSGGAVLFVFNLIILFFEGNTGVAAYGIVANIAFVATALFVGIAQGIQPLSSRSYACNNIADLRKVLRLALGTALVITVVLFAVVMIWTEPIILAFNKDNDPHLTVLAVEGMRLYFAGYFFAGINIVAAAFFSSVELPGRGLIISILRGFVTVILFVFIFASLFGMVGVWVSFPLAEFTTACVTVTLLAVFSRRMGRHHVR